MELFNQFKNDDFKHIRQIIKKTLIYGYDKELLYEFYNTISSKPTDFIDSLFNDDFCILKDEEGDILPFIDYDYDENPYLLPILLTKMEKEYIKTMLNDSLFCALLGEKLANKLSNNLNNTTSLNFKDNIIFKDEQIFDDTPSLIENIKLITYAIINDKNIDFNNNTNTKVYENKNKKIYRILYSPINTFWQVLTHDDNNERVILCNISSMSNIKINDNNDNVVDTKILIKNKKSKTPLKLELKEIHSSLERTFRTFSDYETIAYHKNGIHFLEIYYYEFDKQQIISNILSLGDAVVVDSNSPLYEDICNEIKQIILNH